MTVARRRCPIKRAARARGRQRLGTGPMSGAVPRVGNRTRGDNPQDTGGSARPSALTPHRSPPFPAAGRSILAAGRDGICDLDTAPGPRRGRSLTG